MNIELIEEHVCFHTGALNLSSRARYSNTVNRHETGSNTTQTPPPHDVLRAMPPPPGLHTRADILRVAQARRCHQRPPCCTASALSLRPRRPTDTGAALELASPATDAAPPQPPTLAAIPLPRAGHHRPPLIVIEG
jgi:hypothetical protein